jgi:transcriptional regulator
MYTPDDFKMEDSNEILEFIKSNSFGILVSAQSTFEPLATHLPFYLRQDEPIVLESHLAKSNAQSEVIKNGKTVLAIFSGPNGYISSSVYGHENVPTWNYQSVHLYGTISILNEEEQEHHLADLMTNYENNREIKKEFTKLPKSLIEEYKKEILCFRITVYRMEAAYKLSQNRNQKDHKAIIEDLEKNQENDALVTAMKKHYKK